MPGYFADAVGFENRDQSSPWDMNGSACCLDVPSTDVSGFDIFQDLPSEDEFKEEEVSELQEEDPILFVIGSCFNQVRVHVSDRKPPLIYSVENKQTKE